MAAEFDCAAFLALHRRTTMGLAVCGSAVAMLCRWAEAEADPEDAAGTLDVPRRLGCFGAWSESATEADE